MLNSTDTNQRHVLAFKKDSKRHDIATLSKMPSIFKSCLLKIFVCLHIKLIIIIIDYIRQLMWGSAGRGITFLFQVNSQY